MVYPSDKLSEVFRNIRGHHESSEIIMAHSSNKEDIREFALRNVDLTDVRNIIDLGCGFGFFTQSLKGKISPEATVTGIDCFNEYRQPFLKVCRESGFKGRFTGSGVDALLEFAVSSIDLVLSSFSMYFFPGAVSGVAKVLKNTGTFIIITHYSDHLRELTTLMNEIFFQLGFPQSEPLPHDKLVANFPAENGFKRLSKYFKQIEIRNYENELIFTGSTFHELVKYVHYKRSFFMPESAGNDPEFFVNFEKSFLNRVRKMKEFRISKRDAGFICKHPIKH